MAAFMAVVPLSRRILVVPNATVMGFPPPGQPRRPMSRCSGKRNDRPLAATSRHLYDGGDEGPNDSTAGDNFGVYCDG